MIVANSVNNSGDMDCDEELFSHNLLGFDFDFSSDDTTFTSSDQIFESGSSIGGVRVVKTSKKKLGSKCVAAATGGIGKGSRRSKTRVKSKKEEKEQLHTEEAESHMTLAKPLFYVFPSFDKSDSLIYLPSTLTRHMNSGDSEATAKLMLSHLDKNCIIDLNHHPCGMLNPKSFVKMLDLVTNLHPDSILCAVQTKVEGNTISATLFAKFTDNKVVYDSVRSSLRDPVLRTLFGLPREKKVRRSLEHAPRNEEESQQIITLADSDVDLLVYVRVDFSMMVDEVTKKVSTLKLDSRMTAMHPVLE